MDTKMRKCKWLEKLQDNKSSCIEMLTLLVLGVGLIYAIKAYYVYEEQKKEMSNANRIQVSMSFRNAESEVYKAIWIKPVLMAILTDYPEGTKPNINIARNMVNLFCEENKNCIDQWDNVNDLLAILYQPTHENFHSKDRQTIRAAYDLAENLLYLVADAYSAKNNGIVTEAEYKTFQAYIHDLGFNPLFIAAISYGHSSGYLEKDFAIEIQNELKTDERNWEMLNILYPEIRNPNWADSLSDRCYNKYLSNRNTCKIIK